MKNKILQTIKRENLLTENMHIVVGLSGGPDSVCLFDVLKSMAEEMNLSLYAVHVNHGLRPVAADEDQLYVSEICAEYNVPCYVYKADCNLIAQEYGMTSEEAGRKVRYEAFSKTAERICAEKDLSHSEVAIALAHNANDQAETILFRILRGTGTDGLYGIPYSRSDEKNFKIIRPLLDVSREEIENYCQKQKLFPRIDHTNSENLYTRNKIRNMLIPYIKENFNENITDTIIRLGKVAAEDRDFIRAEAGKVFETSFCSPQAEDSCRESGCEWSHRNSCLSGSKLVSADNKDETANIRKVKAVSLYTEPLLKAHRAVRMRVYTIALSKIGILRNITYAQQEGIDKVLNSKNPSAMYLLTDNARVKREYDKIIFFTDECTDRPDLKTRNGDDMESLGWKLYELTKEEFEEFRLKKEEEAANGNKTVYGAFEGASCSELLLRTRKKGDRIAVAGGSKKIQDFFVDEKVPKLHRDNMLLLAKGSDILWILPSEYFARKTLAEKGRFSERYKVGRYCEELEKEKCPNHENRVIILEKL